MRSGSTTPTGTWSQNQDIITAAFYFNRPPTIASNADCQWGLTASSEYGQLREMAQDTAHFTV